MAFVQGAGLSSASTTNPVTIAFPANVTAGNLIVVDMSAIVSQAPLAGWSVTDSQGNTYAAATGAGIAETTTPITIGTFWAVVKTTGPCTVTATFSSSESGERVYIHEYSGVDMFDVGIGASGNSNLLTATTPATNHPSELVHACGVSNNGVTSAGSGFTMRETGASEGTEDKTVAATGAQTATFPQSSANAWAIMVTTFYSSGGGGGTTVAGSETLSATGSLTDTGAVQRAGSAALTATGSLEADGTVTTPTIDSGSADLEATGSLAADGDVIGAGPADLGEVDLEAEGSMAAAAAVERAGAAALGAAGSLAAAGTVTGDTPETETWLPLAMGLQPGPVLSMSMQPTALAMTLQPGPTLTMTLDPASTEMTLNG